MQEALRRERHLEVAELEEDVAALEGVDLFGLQLLERLAGFGHHLLQAGVVERRHFAGGENTPFFTPSMAPMEWCAHRQDLEAERQHVGKRRVSTISFGIDVVVGAMREAPVEKTRHPAQGLQEGRARSGHRVKSPRHVSRVVQL